MNNEDVTRIPLGLLRPSVPLLGAGHQRKHQRSAATIPAQRHRPDRRHAGTTARLCPSDQPPAPQVPRLPNRLRGLPRSAAGIVLAVHSQRQYTASAVAEDRAPLGSNPSAATTQGQGRRCVDTTSPCPPILLLAQSGKSQGPGDSVPRRTQMNRRADGSGSSGRVALRVLMRRCTRNHATRACD
jgi:hypothetical protein